MRVREVLQKLPLVKQKKSVLGGKIGGWMSPAKVERSSPSCPNLTEMKPTLPTLHGFVNRVIEQVACLIFWNQPNCAGACHDLLVLWARIH